MTTEKDGVPTISERMIDDAKLYCRDAVGALMRGDWEFAAQVLLTRCRKLDLALQSLTPGGSEYVGDPDRCVKFVRDSKASLQRAMLAARKSGGAS